MWLPENNGAYSKYGLGARKKCNVSRAISGRSINRELMKLRNDSHELT